MYAPEITMSESLCLLSEAADEYTELPRASPQPSPELCRVCLRCDVWDACCRPQPSASRSPDPSGLSSRSPDPSLLTHTISVLVYLLCLSTVTQVCSVSALPLDTLSHLASRSLHCPVPQCQCSPAKLSNRIEVNVLPVSVMCTNLTMVPRLEDYSLDVQVLNLSHNSISKVKDDSFQGLKSLRVLDLASNGIREVESKALRGLHELEYLDLSHNDFSILPPVPGSLTHLDLSHNPGLSLEMESLVSLTQLQRLDLAGTGLRDADSLPALGSLPRLSSLSLAANQLQQLNKTQLDALSAVNRVDLSHNPIDCNCSVLGFVRWLNEVDMKVTGDWVLPICYSPESVVGMPLWSLTLADLRQTCPLMANCDPLHPTRTDCQNLTIIGLSYRTSTASPMNTTRIAYKSMLLPYDPMLGWWTAAALGGMVAALIICLLFEKAKQKISQYRRRRWRRKCRRIWEAAKATAGEETTDTDSCPLHNHPVFYSHEIQLDVVPDAMRRAPCAVVVDNQSGMRGPGVQGGERPPEYSRQSSRRLSVSWGPTSDMSSTSPSSTATPTQDPEPPRQSPAPPDTHRSPFYRKTSSQSLLQYLERASHDISVSEVHPDCPIHNLHRKERLKALLKQHPERSLHAILTDDSL